MSERKEQFTPGPWKTESRCAEGGAFFRYAFQVIAPALNKRVCYSETDNKTNIFVLNANAALIAAAPEMYELLDQLTRMGEGLPALIRLQRIQSEATEILKKARGEK